MPTFVNIIEIQRPLEEVFRFAADMTNVPKWNYYVMRVQQLAGSGPNVGARYHQIRRQDKQLLRIIDYRPHEVVTVKTEPGSLPSVTRTMTFEQTATGTRLIDAWQISIGPIPLMGVMGKHRIRAAVAENLGKLKTLLEMGQTYLQDGRLSRLDIEQWQS